MLAMQMQLMMLEILLARHELRDSAADVGEDDTSDDTADATSDDEYQAAVVDDYVAFEGDRGISCGDVSHG